MINQAGVEKDAFNDFGLYIKSKVIKSPPPQLHKIEIIGRDGSIDISDMLSGQMRYKERQIDIVFRFIDAENMRTGMLTDLQNFVHGKAIKFIFNDDQAYFYEGRMTVDDPSVNGMALDINSTIIAQPYKRSIESSADDWLWDPFDFETGVINELHSITVDGTATVTIIGSPYQDNPVITVSSAMTVSYDGGSPISLAIGSQKVYSIIITEGEHEFVFTGNGTATIDYRGGLL